MEYIINPSWFYFVSVLECLHITCSLATFAAVMAILAFGLCVILGIKIDQKYFKPAFIGLAIGILGFVFIPDETTMIEMMVAKYATVDNAQMTLDTIKSAVDYIVQAIAKLK